MLLLMGLTCSVYASNCETGYDKYGCQEAAFDLGDDMSISQYRVIYDRDQDGVRDEKDKCPSTPFRVKVNADGCKIVREIIPEKEIVVNEEEMVIEEPVKIVTLRLNFKTAAYTILENSFDEVNEFAQFLRDHPEYTAKIVGHTDSRDRFNRNMTLSQNRAQAVKDMLINLGVSRDRLSSLGVGAHEPVATNATAEGRALNRRIEVLLTKEGR